MVENIPTVKRLAKIYGQREGKAGADYCTNAVAAVKENPGQRSINLPVSLEVGAAFHKHSAPVGQST
jgi:hypothetical protein